MVLEEEVDRAVVSAGRDNAPGELDDFPRIRLTWDEIKAQLSNWEIRLLEDRGKSEPRRRSSNQVRLARPHTCLCRFADASLHVLLPLFAAVNHLRESRRRDRRYPLEPEPWRSANSGFDPRDAIQVSQMILRHRLGPACKDVASERPAVDSASSWLSSSVRGGTAHRRRWPAIRSWQCSTNEHAKQGHVVRRPARKLDAGKTGRENSSPFDGRHDESESVQSVRDLLPRVGQRHDRRRGVGNRRGQFAGKLGIDRCQQPRRGRAPARRRSGASQRRARISPDRRILKPLPLDGSAAIFSVTSRQRLLPSPPLDTRRRRSAAPAAA